MPFSFHVWEAGGRNFRTGGGKVIRLEGAKTDRPELAKAIRRLEHGDVLVVTRLVSLSDLKPAPALATASRILSRSRVERASRSRADTTTPHWQADADCARRSCGVRARAYPRTDDGRRRAQARGVRFGRPLALTAIQRLSNGEAQADVARSFNVSRATISRLAAPSPFEASAAGLRGAVNASGWPAD
jgi:hypothetical protein